MQLNVRWGMQRLVGSTAQQRMVVRIAVAATGSRSTQQATGNRQVEHERTGNQQAKLQQLINPQTNGSKCWTIVRGNCHLYPTSVARAASLFCLPAFPPSQSAKCKSAGFSRPWRTQLRSRSPWQPVEKPQKYFICKVIRFGELLPASWNGNALQLRIATATATATATLTNSDSCLTRYGE